MRRAFSLLALVVLATTTRAAVTGRVMDPDGKPLAGVRVRAFPPETVPARLARLMSATPERAPVGAVETKGDGTFTIDAKGNGVVTLLLEAPDRDWRSFEAVDGEDAGAFVLRPAGTVRGRVTAGGKGVANALLVLAGHLIVRSGEDGSYEVAPTGDHDPESFYVLHPDYAPLEGFGFGLSRDSRRRTSRYDVELRAGAVLTGRVLAADGKTPVAGATIRVGSWPLAKSGEDGMFRIANAPEAQTLIAIEGSRLGSAGIDRRKASYDLVLRPGAALSGMVRNVKDGRPVAGAQVMAQHGAGTSRQHFAAISDAKGNYTIHPLPAMSGFVYIQHPAYLATPPPPVEIGEAARVALNLDATPHARLRGTVLDERRSPVSAARVSLMLRTPSVLTGPDGSFALRAPHASEPLMVSVSKQGYATTAEGPIALKPGDSRSLQITLRKGFRFEITLLDADGKPAVGEPLMLLRWADVNERRPTVPMLCTRGEIVECGTTDENGQRAYEILEGKYEILAGGTATMNKLVSGVMIDARSEPLTIRLERGVAISGRVVDADDKPVANVFVMTAQGGRFRTDAAGAFSLPSLAAGTSVTLTAQTTTDLATEPVTVTAPASDVVLRFPRPARIEGRVFDRDSKAPLREFSVTVRDRRVRPMSPSRTFTPDDGRFVLDEVSPGELDLAVNAKGYVPGSVVDVKASPGGTTTVEIALDRGATLKGRVTSGGQPLGDVMVIPIVMGSGSGMRGMQTQRPVRTDASGEFAIDGIAPGAQRFDFRKQGYVPVSKTLEVLAGRETRAEVELARGRDLQVRVHEQSGRPVANAEVLIRNAPGPMNRTDAEGSVTVEGLADQSYLVTARKDGYTNAEQEVNPARTPSITLTLGRGGSLRGRVAGVAEGELSMVEISASDSRQWRTTARPDARGDFVLEGVPDGSIGIRAVQSRPVRRSSELKTVEVANGSGPFVQIDFTSGIAVRGRVTRNGVPVEGGGVNFIPSPNVPPASRPSSSAWAEIRDGLYEVRVSEPGEYEVRVSAIGSGGAFAQKVKVTSPMTHDIEIRGVTLRGRVVDERSGEPIAGARVEVSLEGRLNQSAVSDSAGRFSLDGLGEGSWRVLASRESFVSEPVEITAGESGAVEIEVRLRQALPVGVKVVDAATGSLLDASISLRDAARTQPATSRPAPRVDGGVQRLWLLPGSYSAGIWVEGYVAKTVDVQVPGPDLHVMLERAGRIDVRGGVPGGVQVVLRAAADSKRVRSMSMRQAQFQNVAPGVYVIEVLDAEQKVLLTRANVHVVAGQTTTVTLP